MFGRPSEPVGFNRLELPCIWARDGGPVGGMPWSQPVSMPAMWIPDGYQGPPPGYPWMEFGRLTLPAEPRAAGAPTAGAVIPGGAVPAAAAPDVAPSPRWLAAVPLAPGADDTARSPHPGYADPNVGAATQARDVLSDLRAAMVALDAASQSNPIVASLARNGSGAGISAYTSDISSSTANVLGMSRDQLRAALAEWLPATSVPPISSRDA